MHPSAGPPLAELPDRELLARHVAVLPQPDQLCGPFAAHVALHGVRPDPPGVTALARAAGVADDQAIASSFEIGVHNGTLAIFVAVEVFDSTEISVPAAVYSVFMFFLAAAWGAFVSRRVAARAPVTI